MFKTPQSFCHFGESLQIRAALFSLAFLCSSPVFAAPGEVIVESEINDVTAGFAGVLANADFFGSASASLGDLDGDGVPDLAVGTPGSDDGGVGRGAVWVLFLNADGTVKREQKISDTAGGFTGTLDDQDQFGQSLANLGDLDGDGVTDLAVGAQLDDDGGFQRGAFYVLFLDTDGTVKSQQKVSDTAGGFGGTLDDEDSFGIALANLGDVDGDGVADMAVGAHQDDDGGAGRGSVWVLFMNTDGTVKSHQKISATSGGFAGTLDDGDLFGVSVAGLSDRNGDGVSELAVGADQDDDGGLERGAVWVLFLNPDGTVFREQKISATSGGFLGSLVDGDLFGRSVTDMTDLNGDGFGDIVVGASQDDDGGSARGAAWVIFLNPDGTVSGEQKISDLAGGFVGVLNNGDRFGSSIARAGDINADGVEDLAIGAIFDQGGGVLRGATWTVFLDGAVCGDLTMEFEEACDDGGLNPGDGCSARCQVEALWNLSGTAVGGYGISFDVDGLGFGLITTAGQSAGEVAQAIADVINGHATLQMNGTTANADGGMMVITNGLLENELVTDPGLGVQQVPAISYRGLAGLIGLMAICGWGAASRRERATAL